MHVEDMQICLKGDFEPSNFGEIIENFQILRLIQR